jgi:hypothetical protein
MKNKLFTAILIAGLAFASFGTNNLYGQAPMSKMAMKDSTMKYTCPHHPDVLSDKPGKCACGMDLVAAKGKDEMTKKPKMMKEDMMETSKDMKKDNKKMMKENKMDAPMDMKENKKKMMKDSTMMKTK